MSQTVAPHMPDPPLWRLPDNACDCHTHVFGPYDRFPVIHEMPYAAPLAPAELHRQMLDRVGATRGVLIQPGAFGTDPSVILEALAQAGGRLRGIAAATAAVTDEDLDAWHTAGVRGLRFNEMLADVAAQVPSFHYVDLRDVVGEDDWANELHPNNSGFGRAADRFAARIRALGPAA